MNNNNNNNLYEILGISKTATQEEIKKAYRKLSLELHPDRNHGSDESTEKFKKISNAYETLGDEEKRKAYDMRGNNFTNGGPGINPNDLFNFFTQNIFGNMGQPVNVRHVPFPSGAGPFPPGAGPFPPGAGPSQFGPGFFNVEGNGESIRQGLNKPMPIMKNLEITLTKSYVGCTFPLEITRWVNENGIKREETETIYINIPKGVDNNELIILRDKGHIINDTIKGDIKIFISVKNDTEFVRSGLDLVFNKTISLKEALCGFSFDMKYLDGKTFKINNGNGNVIGFNYKKVLPDMGMKRDNHSGNIIINFNVVFPEKLTQEQIDSLLTIL
jgi:DnaJ-class molecular chaperone